jgi:hypothetical protein
MVVNGREQNAYVLAGRGAGAGDAELAAVLR